MGPVIGSRPAHRTQLFVSKALQLQHAIRVPLESAVLVTLAPSLEGTSKHFEAYGYGHDAEAVHKYKAWIQESYKISMTVSYLILAQPLVFARGSSYYEIIWDRRRQPGSNIDVCYSQAG
ncbi:hypothetical protein DL769_007801 [Monosporascus sp. CRB-8-3]|nr:hypothetical protein DL769_007801 [Monosporascus sp. CRB-8-3]